MSSSYIIWDVLSSLWLGAWRLKLEAWTFLFFFLIQYPASMRSVFCAANSLNVNVVHFISLLSFCLWLGAAAPSQVSCYYGSYTRSRGQAKCIALQSFKGMTRLYLTPDPKWIVPSRFIGDQPTSRHACHRIRTQVWPSLRNAITTFKANLGRAA